MENIDILTLCYRVLATADLLGTALVGYLFAPSPTSVSDPSEDELKAFPVSSINALTLTAIAFVGQLGGNNAIESTVHMYTSSTSRVHASMGGLQQHPLHCASAVIVCTVYVCAFVFRIWYTTYVVSVSP